MNLLIRLRRHVADPPTPEPRDLPMSALAGADRRRYFRQRRRHDPLGGGHSCTWRSWLIKVAAEVLVSTSRALVRLAGNWPHHAFYRAVCQRLAARARRSAWSG